LRVILAFCEFSTFKKYFAELRVSRIFLKRTEDFPKSGGRLLNQPAQQSCNYRQKFIDEQHPLHVLIEENFPHEYRDVLLPCATGRGHQCAGTSSSEEPEWRWWRNSACAQALRNCSV